MWINQAWWRKIKIVIIMSIPVVIFLGVIGWYKLFREVPQPEFEDEAERFKYGSLGSESDRGIPYWVWLVLPRIFPDLLPGPGGYKSFGMVWEPGQELPAGFAKKTVGFPRVTNNCASCHTATFRVKEDATPEVVAAGPAHTSNVQSYLRFLFTVAEDPRFNSDVILAEIDLVYELSWLDKLLYRYAIIPFTKKALLEQRDQFAWMNREGLPDWGPGRDDPMNLTKYFMTDLPLDDTVGSADFPSVWNMGIRKGHPLNLDGVTPSLRSVIIDSALGLGAPPGEPFLREMERLEKWLNSVPPPDYPFRSAVNKELAAAGKAVYDQHCFSCHSSGGERFGQIVDIDEIGTDRGRLDTWTQKAADKANEKVLSLGIKRDNMVKTNGYVSQPLDGVWLRAPYLHNGSVPNLRDLLEPEGRRTQVFYRGYDVYDPVNVGFVTQGAAAEREGFLFDTSLRGNGNQGHTYGTNLSKRQTEALLEYLKTL